MIKQLEGLLQKYPALQDRIASIPDYSITMAQRNLIRAVNFTIMMAERIMEAAATSPQKVLTAAGIPLSVRNGAMIDGLKDVRETGKIGNGLWIEYEDTVRSDPAYRAWLDSLGGWIEKDKFGSRPSAESLIQAFEELGRIFKNDIERREKQYNALKSSMLDFDITRHQARGLLRIAEKQLQKIIPLKALAAAA